VAPAAAGLGQDDDSSSWESGSSGGGCNILNLDIASGTRELGQLQLLSVMASWAGAHPTRSPRQATARHQRHSSLAAEWQPGSLGQRRARDGGWPDLRMMVPTELGNVSFGLENGGRNVRSNETRKLRKVGGENTVGPQYLNLHR